MKIRIEAPSPGVARAAAESLCLRVVGGVILPPDHGQADPGPPEAAPGDRIDVLDGRPGDDEGCVLVGDPGPGLAGVIGQDGRTLRFAVAWQSVLDAARKTGFGNSEFSIDAGLTWRGVFLCDEEGVMRKVIVTISPDGAKVTAEVVGGSGPSCSALTDLIKKALGGAVVGESNLPEFFEGQDQKLTEGGPP